MTDQFHGPRAHPTLVDAQKLAEMLDVSLRHVRRLDSTGKLPSGILIGRCKRWLVADVLEWLRAGSPPRVDWERAQKTIRTVIPIP